MSKKSAPFRMSPIAHAARALAVLATVVTPGLALADQLTFPEKPLISIGGGSTTTTTTKKTVTTETQKISGGVAPNIILSIDDSASMAIACDAVCTTPTGTNCGLARPTPYYSISGITTVCGTINGQKYQPRINALKDALIATFGSPGGDQYRGKFRLAFQAYWNNLGFGPNRFFVPTSGGTPIDNRLRWFDATQQTRFINWVNTLSGLGVDSTGTPLSNTTSGKYSTPSQLAMIYAGEYLNRRWLDSSNLYSNTTRLNFQGVPDSENPWNANPGTADSNRLPCRRAYHILLSDGMWNSQTPSSGTTQLTMPFVSGLGTGGAANYDGFSFPLPKPLDNDDGTQTTQFPGNLPIYSDSTPSSTASGNSSTLSDFSLYYWGRNLSGDTSYKVVPKFAVTGDETVTSPNGSASWKYSKNWNPKNDPATWQHMQTYTIGYGTQDNNKIYNAFQNTNANPPSNIYGAGSITTSPAYNGFFDSTFYKAIASGATSWPAATSGTNGALYDLVHAAYNGRGKFYQASDAAALQNIFNEILQLATAQSSDSTISPPDDVGPTETTDSTTNSTGGTASAAGSSTQLAGGMAYKASYNYKVDQTNNGLGGWIGSVTSYSGSDLAGTPAWIASIDPSSRTIFTAKPGTCTPTPPATTCVPPHPTGTTLTGAGMTDTFSTMLHAQSVLGDIVNSQLVYVGKPTLGSPNAGYLKFAASINTNRVVAKKGMVYVGSNDGMMHAFNAGNGMPTTITTPVAGNPGNGKEAFAYVPLGLQSRVSAIGNDTDHHWGVNSGMFSGDARLDKPTYASVDYSPTPPSTTPIPETSKNWATVLVGTLGAGGPGYFVLDVTDPTKITESDTSVLAKAVLVDRTDPTAVNDEATPYIGNQFGQPVMDQYSGTLQSAQIVQINTQDAGGEWAVIMGNGYNSTNGVPVLLIQSLSHTDRPLYTVPASCSGACVAGNGLGQPRAVDVDGNGTVDIVYAGDLMGNLWKFDISNPDHSTPGKWSATSIFQAVGPTNVAQPITSAPVVVPNKKGGFIVGFGTGKNLTQADTQDAPAGANPPLNSFYVLYDTQKMSLTTVTVGSQSVSKVTLDPDTVPSFCTGGSYSCLYKRESATLTGTGDGTLNSIASNTPTPSTASIGGTSGKLGWYFNIPEIDNGNAAKVLANPMMLQGNFVVFFADNVASGESTTGNGNGTPQNIPVDQPPIDVKYDPSEAIYNSYAQTVAAIQAGAAPPASSVESCNEQKATKTTTITTITKERTTTPGTSVQPLLRSINYFSLIDGSLPENITVTIGTVTYNFNNPTSSSGGGGSGGGGSGGGGSGGSGSGGSGGGSEHGNRFRITVLPTGGTGTGTGTGTGSGPDSGTDSGSPITLHDPNGDQCVGTGTACGTQVNINPPAGRRAGWRFGR